MHEEPNPQLDFTTPESVGPRAVADFDFCSDIDGVRFAVCAATQSTTPDPYRPNNTTATTIRPTHGAQS